MTRGMPRGIVDFIIIPLPSVHRHQSEKPGRTFSERKMASRRFGHPCTVGVHDHAARSCEDCGWNFFGPLSIGIHTVVASTTSTSDYVWSPTSKLRLTERWLFNQRHHRSRTSCPMPNFASLGAFS
jgi:hypothetical protein